MLLKLRKRFTEQYKELKFWYEYECDWFNFYNLRAFKRWVQRCWAWNKFFWKAEVEEWDYAGLCKIFAFAIRRQADEIESNARHTTYKEDVKNMRVTARLIERYGEDKYIDEWLEKVFTDGYWEERFEVEYHPEFGEIYKRVDRRSQEEIEQEAKELKRMYNYEQYMREQDMRLFCQYLTKT